MAEEPKLCKGGFEPDFFKRPSCIQIEYPQDFGGEGPFHFENNM